MPTTDDLYNRAQVLKIDEREVESKALADLAANWKDRTIPHLQSSVSDHQMTRFRSGDVDAVFASLLQALRSIKRAPRSLLDAACATGYYSEVIRRAWPSIEYLGSDYSEAMIETARSRYPKEQFRTEDATKLSFKEHQFGCVMLSGALEHIPNYLDAISEICRVAEEYVVLHRLLVIPGHEIRHMIGSQYSIVTPRIYYPRSFIQTNFRQYGFKVVADIPTYARSLMETMRMVFRHSGPDIRTMVFRRIGPGR